jgi:magnesium transporter
LAVLSFGAAIAPDRVQDRQMTAPARQRRVISGARRLRSGGAPSTATAPSAQLNVRVVEHNGLRWYDIRRPSAADVEFLRAEFAFHPLALEDVVSRTQRPKLDLYDGYMFVVLHFPVHNKATRLTVASEVDIIVGHDYVVTCHEGNLKPLVRMFDNALESEEVRVGLMGQTSAHLLYYIIDRLVDYCFPIVSKLTERIEMIEDAIFDESSLKTVQEISIVRRDLITMRRIMKPQLSVVSQLENRGLPMIHSDIELYFGDIADHLAKIWDSLEDLKDVLDGLSSTFDSLASHRLNEVIKALTVISVVILPLTLITGVFGMNVPLPYDESEVSLAGIVAVMVLISAAMLFVFRKRHWI